MALQDDNMGKVIDIFSRTEFKDDNEGFYSRFKKCYEMYLERGYCSCELCENKREIAYKTITYAKNECHKYAKSTGETLYWGDLLEILLIASRETKDFINYEGEE